MTVSPGSSNAMYTAAFIGAPERGWTLACSQPNSCFALEMASRSIASVKS